MVGLTKGSIVVSLSIYINIYTHMYMYTDIKIGRHMYMCTYTICFSAVCKLESATELLREVKEASKFSLVLK